MVDTSKGIASSAYRPRILDAKVERYLELFGAVEISGTKWCGKTWTALAHGKSVTYVDRGSNLDIVAADPSYALAGENPHVIDEWQRVPAIWDTVRHAVDDAGGEKGLWILTGSSTPADPNMRSHSGAGRIGRIHMRPMTLQESEDSSASVSLAGLFEGRLPHAQCSDGIASVAELACRGGWPEEAFKPSQDALIVTREYLSLIFEESIPRLGGEAGFARRVATSLARNLGQAFTNKTLEVSRYLKLLKKLFLVDEVPGWVPASRSPLRMRTKPKYYFADPSLAVSLLGLSPAALLEDFQTFGLVFENLVMRDLDVYSRALENVGDVPLRYYRDDSDLEVDVIIERADGSWGAIEIELSQAKAEEAAKNLVRLREKLLADGRKRTPAPAFLTVVTGVGEAPYRRPDGVCVIPIRALGA